jgi:hypothetical protein
MTNHSRTPDELADLARYGRPTLAELRQRRIPTMTDRLADLERRNARRQADRRANALLMGELVLICGSAR